MWRFCDVFTRNVPVAVGLSVMSKAAVGERVSLFNGGNIGERELLNKESDRETGDQALSNSWLFIMFLFIL